MQIIFSAMNKNLIMKKILTKGLAIVLFLTLFTSCKKTETQIINRPDAHAGKDTVITLPANSLLLHGSSSRHDGNQIVSYLWTVSGPSSVSIITSPYSASTMVQNLVKGTYTFTFSITYGSGHTSTDEMEVIVWDPQHLKIKSVTDTTIRLPYNRASLQETVHFYNSVSSWEKISGPNSFSIPFPNSTKAIVSNLVAGVYKFKLTSTYWNYQTRTDTMTVTVFTDTNKYTAEKLFENLQWIADDWGGGYFIKINISTFFPAGHHFKVLLKKDTTSEWEIVIPSAVNNTNNIYENSYEIANNFLLIFSIKPISAQIKIVY
jgi:hypothetical protein